MAFKPMRQLGIEPVDDLDTDLVLIQQLRGEPQQRLVVEYPIAEVSDLVECRRNVPSLSLRLRATGKHQAQILPEHVLELGIKQRAPEAESQLGQYLVHGLRLFVSAQFFLGTDYLFVLPVETRLIPPCFPPIPPAIEFAQADMDPIAQRYLQDIEHRNHRFGQQQV